MKFTQNICLAVVALFGLCGCAYAGYAPAPYAAPAMYQSPVYLRQAHYAKPAVYATPAYTPETADAAASAITDIAAAKASAAKINSVNLHVLDHYGHEIGVPLLIKPYGDMTGLMSALSPKRSYVGTIDAGFRKDNYGKIKFIDESSIGAIALS